MAASDECAKQEEFAENTAVTGLNKHRRGWRNSAGILTVEVEGCRIGVSPVCALIPVHVAAKRCG